MTTDQVQPDTRAATRPHGATSRNRPVWPRTLHRFNAALAGLFVLAHIGNHVLALNGPAAHIRAMEWLRLAYRVPLVEAVLLASVTIQTLSGLRLLRQDGTWRRRGLAKLQVYSGAYLALFLVIHLSAIAWGRLGLKLDTNFYFAAAGLNIAPFPLFFVPYYFLAILAVFAHVACALHRLLRSRLSLRQRDTIVLVAMGTGIVLASLIIASFCGLIEPLTIPAAYRASFG